MLKIALETFQTIIYPIIDILAVLALVLGIRAFILIKRQDRMPEVKTMLSKVFLLFIVGITLWVIAEIGWDVWSFTSGETPDISFLDAFWMLGYFFVVPAFLVFTSYVLKKKENLKKGLLAMIITAVAAGIITFFLINNVMIAGLEGEGWFELLVYFFYPIASAVMVVSASTVYAFFRQIGNLKVPLLLLAIGAAASFFGDTLFTYVDWNEIYGLPGVLSDTFYAIDYGCWAAAFYLFIKRLKGDKQ